MKPQAKRPLSHLFDQQPLSKITLYRRASSENIQDQQQENLQGHKCTRHNSMQATRHETHD